MITTYPKLPNMLGTESINTLASAESDVHRHRNNEFMTTDYVNDRRSREKRA